MFSSDANQIDQPIAGNGAWSSSRQQGRHFSFYQGGVGKILTDFLGRGKIWGRKHCVQKTKSHYFSNSHFHKEKTISPKKRFSL